MNTSKKGTRAEHRARVLLEQTGYHVVRAAGSRGVADLVAWDATSVRILSIKSGNCYASALEREALRQLPRPPNATIEIWRYPDRCRAPLIERL